MSERIWTQKETHRLLLKNHWWMRILLLRKNQVMSITNIWIL